MPINRILFTAFFFDFFSFSLIIPLLPLLVFAYCPETKYMTLGFLLATYPFAQMMGSRFLGKLSDRIGKKKILLLAYLGNLIGYGLSALSIYQGNITYLFLGHLIAGFLGANMSMTYALIADGVCEKTKFRSFSLTGFILSITFVLSPLISKKMYLCLGSIETMGLVTLSIAAGATLFNLSLISLLFKSSPPQKAPQRAPLKQLRSRPLLASSFLFFFAWYGFIKFFQAYALDDLFLSYDRFCVLLSLMGGSSALMQVMNLFYFTPSPRVLRGAIYLLACSIGALLFITSYEAALALTILISLSHALISPRLLYAFSSMSPNTGEMMGNYQAIQSLAKTLAPPLLGLLMTTSLKSPLALCSLCLFIAPTLYISSYGRHAAPASSAQTE